MKAIFERKPSDFDLRSFEVSKTIRLPAEVFEGCAAKTHEGLRLYSGEYRADAL
ncbi:MAG: hypothetical protein ACOX0U_03715 [Oscillospiraceae bacterium]